MKSSTVLGQKNENNFENLLSKVADPSTRLHVQF